MLRPQPSQPPPEPPLQVVLTCGNQGCRHTFAPDPDAFASANLACPACGGWTFHAELAEPADGGAH